MRALRCTSILVVLLAILISTTIPAVAQSWITDVWTGGTPKFIAVNPATNRIYVVNLFDETVTVVDGATNTVIGNPIPVGSGPTAIAVNPLTNRIYVVNDDDDNVTVIRGESNTAYTIPVAHYPYAIAIDTATNKIYVTGDTWDGKLTRIDGATNLTSTIAVRNGPESLAMNSSTKKMYVANRWDPNTVSVVDLTTFTNVKTILVGHNPNTVVVNAMTNQIYILNDADDSISVINGATDTVQATIPQDSPRVMALNPVTNTLYVGNDNGIVTIIRGTEIIGTINTQKWSSGMVVNPVTNTIYITNAYNDSLTIVDGATNTLRTVLVGNGPEAVIANLSINRVYTVNPSDNTISVVAGAASSPLQFVSLTPCRLVDTRKPGGGGAIPGGTWRSFAVPQLGACGAPSADAVYSLNVTVVPHGPLGYVTIWPSGEDQPLVSTMNSFDGRFKANAAIVAGGYQGAVSVYASDTTDVVLDINGYFKPADLYTTQFYPLTPCRVIDTRTPNGPLGGPYMSGGVPREFPVASSACFPQGAVMKAYSFNFTAVPHTPHHPLGYLSVWSGGVMPVVSTLNNPTGTIVANAAIVPADVPNGTIFAYPDQDTDLVVDINGYFADPGAGGLSLYPVAPCRVLDTRKVGNGQPFTGLRPVDVGQSACAPPSIAGAFAFNATVVPTGGFGYLTLWPHGQQQPLVSTLNAPDGLVTSNMAIVPTISGWIDAYAAGTTQLILDMSAYFAPVAAEQ